MRTREAKPAKSDLIISGGGERATSIAESSDEQFDRLVDFITDNLALSSRRVYKACPLLLGTSRLYSPVVKCV